MKLGRVMLEVFKSFFPFQWHFPGEPGIASFFEANDNLGLSKKDAQSRNKWRSRIRGQLANPGSPGKTAIKTECV